MPRLAVSLARGLVHHVRLRVASTMGHWQPVQRHMAVRSLAQLDRWYERPGEDVVAWLHHAERSTFSQNGEDGLLEALLDLVGTTNRSFVEIGAADGTENCTRLLVERGWRGVWLEADEARAAAASRVVAGRDVVVRQAVVTSRNVVELLRGAGADREPDVVVIDIDGSDLWVARALLRSFSPRVMVVEYNSAFPPGVFWTRRNRGSYVWDETYRHGASLDALTWALGARGYRLVACDRNGVNAFFVRDDVANEAGLGRHDVAALYRPLTIAPAAVGHPWRIEPPCRVLRADERHLVRIEAARVAFCRPSSTSGERVVGVLAQVRNDSDVHLSSTWPAPVRLSAHELDAAGAVVRFDGDRNQLHGGVRPHKRATVAGLFRVGPSTTSLRLCLVQDGVAWFDNSSFDVTLG